MLFSRIEIFLCFIYLLNSVVLQTNRIKALDFYQPWYGPGFTIAYVAIVWWQFRTSIHCLGTAPIGFSPSSYVPSYCFFCKARENLFWWLKTQPTSGLLLMLPIFPVKYYNISNCCIQEFNRRVLEGFQVTPLWHQGFIRDDGRWTFYLCGFINI